MRWRRGPLILLLPSKENVMTNNNRLWRWLAFIFVLSFGALGYLGVQIYLTAPPIPSAVTSANGEVVFTGEQVRHGQQVWLSAGGQQLGSVWGHGGYVAPDWSADWLHREAVALRNRHAEAYRKDFDSLSPADRGALAATVLDELRRNTYDAASGVVTVSADRAKAIREVAGHYDALFGDSASLATLRTQYAIRRARCPSAPTARHSRPSSSGPHGPQPPTGPERRA
jgi:nitric oxide reductase subunit B